MDLCISLETSMFLLSIFLQIVAGFSIGGHTNPNQGRHQRSGWQGIDANVVRDIADRMEQQQQQQQQQQHNQIMQNHHHHQQQQQQQHQYANNVQQQLQARSNLNANNMLLQHEPIFGLSPPSPPHQRSSVFGVASDSRPTSADVAAAAAAVNDEEDASPFLYGAFTPLSERRGRQYGTPNAEFPGGDDSDNEIESAFVGNMIRRSSKNAGIGNNDDNHNINDEDTNNNNNNNNIASAVDVVNGDNGVVDDSRLVANDVTDDEIDVIATFSYPKSVSPVLDNLSLSTKIGLLSVPSKRQQGWHTPYGKRATILTGFRNVANNDNDGDGDNDDNNDDDDNIHTADDNSNSINYSMMKPKRQTTINNGQFQKFPTTKSVAVQEKYPKFKLNFELRRSLDQLENDLKVNNMAYDIVKKIIDEKTRGNQIQQLLHHSNSRKDRLQPHSSVKRQQGWYTSYGKRSFEQLPNNSFS